MCSPEGEDNFIEEVQENGSEQLKKFFLAPGNTSRLTFKGKTLLLALRDLIKGKNYYLNKHK